MSFSLMGYGLVLLAIAIFVALRPLCKQKSSTMKLSLFALILFVIPLLAYVHWGAGAAWYRYQQQLAKQKQVNAVFQSVRGNPQLLVNQLKKRLEQQPKSARGWYLLGRLYASQGEWQQAHDSFIKAYQLKPDSEKITINYVQSLWQINHQQFNAEMRGLLKAVRQKNPNQPDALAMLAMDAYLGHAYEQAIEYWQQLLKIVPPQSEDALAIRKAIAKAQQKL